MIGRRVILGQDRLGVARAVATDMGDRLVHPVHELHRDDPVQELATEIVGCRGHGAGDAGQLAVRPHLDARVQKVAHQHVAVLRVEAPVDQQAFRRAADAGAAGLGVDDDAAGFLQVGGGARIDVADAFQMGEHRHPRLGLDKAHKAFAAARDDDVDHPLRAQHRAHGGAVAGRHHLDRRLGQTRLPQPRDHAVVDQRRGIDRIRPAAQDDGVPGLHRQRARIGGHVRPAFVDHAQHPQRRCHALDVQPVRPVPFGQHPAHGIGLFGHRPQPLGNGADARGGQRQPVDHRGGQALRLGVDQILGVGVEDGVLARRDLVRGADQGGVFAFGPGGGQHLRRLARGGAHAGDQFVGGLGRLVEHGRGLSNVTPDRRLQGRFRRRIWGAETKEEAR